MSAFANEVFNPIDLDESDTDVSQFNVYCPTLDKSEPHRNPNETECRVCNHPYGIGKNQCHFTITPTS